MYRLCDYAVYRVTHYRHLQELPVYLFTPPRRLASAVIANGDLEALRSAWPGIEKLIGCGKIVAMGVDHRDVKAAEGTPVLYVFKDVEMFFYPGEERTVIQASTLVKLLKDTVKVPHG